MSAANKFSDAASVRGFALAGNSTITLRSQRTDKHLTFKIRKPRDKDVYFVRLLTGTKLDDRDHYSFLGTIFANGQYRPSSRSPIPPSHPATTAFPWFWKATRLGIMPSELEVWHEGRCGRCGRQLTDPESIENGIGPECRKKHYAN